MSVRCLPDMQQTILLSTGVIVHIWKTEAAKTLVKFLTTLKRVQHSRNAVWSRADATQIPLASSAVRALSRLSINVRSRG